MSSEDREKATKKHYPTTPDGRYFVVKGRLWRCSNPALPEAERQHLVKALMQARRDVGLGKRSSDTALIAEARQRVQQAKVALGERGDVWWTDGAPDYNRRLVQNTPYFDWYASLDGCD